MIWKIQALDSSNFDPLWTLSDEELHQYRAVRKTVTSPSVTPCRVSLEDAEPGERVLLVNFAHLPAETPYHASFAIYVREGVKQAEPLPGDVPVFLEKRLISLRGFDANNFLCEADVVEGKDLAGALSAMFDSAKVSFVHIHNAKTGCYLAKAARTG